MSNANNAQDPKPVAFSVRIHNTVGLRGILGQGKIIPRVTFERWEKIKGILDSALDLRPEERSAYISRACDGDSTLVLAVSHLVTEYEKAGTFLDGPIMRARTTLVKGQLIGERYQIQQMLGRGGMGEVYEAQDRLLKESVALKTLRADLSNNPFLLRRFQREIQLSRKITHPNVCRLFEVGVHEGGIHYFTMELLVGETLGARIKRNGRLRCGEAFPLVVQMAAGLRAAHDAGIIHRDFKSANVILAGDRAVVTDFGLAGALPGHAVNVTRTTEATAVLGTVAYMSPEQMTGGKITPASDIYSLGVVLFEMVSGRLPYDSEHVIQSAMQRAGRVPSVRSFAPDVDSRWEYTIGRCLQQDPELRPQKATEVLEMLQRWNSVRSVLALPVALPITRRSAVLGPLSIGAISAAYYFRSRRKPSFSRGVRIVIANGSGTNERVVSAAMTQVRASLAQSGFLFLWDSTRLTDVWARMGRNGQPNPTPQEWREIAIREGVPLVLFASVNEVGEGVSFSLRIEHATGDPEIVATYWQKSFEAPSTATIFQTFDIACRWVRDVIGESSEEVATASAAPEKVTTSSWRALDAFSRAEHILGSADHTRTNTAAPAILALREATRFDPDFTMAWMRLGDVQMMIGSDRDAFLAWQQAVQTSRKRPLTRREDLRFRAMWATDSGDYYEAEKLFAEYAHYYPEEWYGPFFRSLPLLLLGQADEAILAMEQCIRFPERKDLALLQLSWADLYKNDRDAATKYIDEMRRSGLRAHAGYAEAVLGHDAGDITRALEGVREAERDEKIMNSSKADLCRLIILADCGSHDRAISAASDSAQRDSRQGARDQFATKLLGMAAIMLDRSDTSGAVRTLRVISNLPLGPIHIGQCATLLARGGRPDIALGLLDRLPEELHVPVFDIARLRIDGEVALARGETAKGIQALERAARKGAAGYGKDYRAFALEKGGRLAEAKAEYEAFLKGRSFQLRLATPEPPGACWRASRSAQRLL